MSDPHKRNAGIAFGVLLSSSATLLCCVLPAVMVSMGAGAALVGFVSVFPQLVWLSEHKALVFGVSGLPLIAGGILAWRARRLPCPVDPVAARGCKQLRRLSAILLVTSMVMYLTGVAFAFVIPWLMDGSRP
jgi:hypothetical protein